MIARIDASWLMCRMKPLDQTALGRAMVWPHWIGRRTASVLAGCRQLPRWLQIARERALRTLRRVEPASWALGSTQAVLA